MGELTPPERVAVQLEVDGLELKLENWWRQRFHPHWLVKKQKDDEKRATHLSLLSARLVLDSMGPPFLVTLTRRSMANRPPDEDGLAGAFKYVQDTVAKFLRIDDGDRARLQFVRQHERGPKGLRIRIEGTR